MPYQPKQGEPLFLGARGDRLVPRIIQRQMQKIRAYLGLPDNLTPHARCILLQPTCWLKGPTCAQFRNC